MGHHLQGACSATGLFSAHCQHSPRLVARPCNTATPPAPLSSQGSTDSPLSQAALLHLEHACSCCRAIITGEHCLLFEPECASSLKFLETIMPRLTTDKNEQRLRQLRRVIEDEEEDVRPPPFELELAEAALLVATGGQHEP